MTALTFWGVLLESPLKSAVAVAFAKANALTVFGRHGTNSKVSHWFWVSLCGGNVPQSLNDRCDNVLELP